MSDTTHTSAARHAFQQLLAGAPNGATAEALGPWWQAYSTLKDTYDVLGAEAATDAFNRLISVREGRGLLRLLSGQVESTRASRRPELPHEVAALLRHEAPCGRWLDEYVAFATLAAPMTPRSFHEAAGLFLASTAIARRLVSISGLGETFPNLFILEVAAPAIYKKTTGLKVAARLLEAAGLAHMLLAQTITPQALVEELGTTAGDKIRAMDEETRQLWLLERAFAAQRAWRMDEAAQLFDSFEREYNTGLQHLILQLFDCEDPITAQTNSRGRTTVRRSYLAFLGATTPESIRKHLSSRALWGTGLWSRFCITTPDTEPVYAPRPAKTPIPGGLVQGLRRIFELFPIPRAELTQEADESGKPRPPTVDIYNAAEPCEVQMAPGVEEGLSTYNEHMSFHMLRRGAVEPLFHSAYDRLSLHVLKVAMLLATMDSPTRAVTIELRHLARAVRIVESWRESLHRMYSEIAATDESILTERIVELLAKKPTGLTVRELCQLAHERSADVRQALQVLQEAGQVETLPAGRTQVWIASKSVASVAKCSTDAATLSSPSESAKPESVAL